MHLPELFKSRNPITLLKFPPAAERRAASEINLFELSSSIIIGESRFCVVGFMTIVPPPFIFMYPLSGFRGVFDLLGGVSFGFQKSVIFDTFSTACETLAFFGFAFGSGSETF